MTSTWPSRSSRWSSMKFATPIARVRPAASISSIALYAPTVLLNSVGTGWCSRKRSTSSTPRFSVRVGMVIVANVVLLECDLELQDLALVHRAVAVGDVLDRAGAVEDTTRLDPPFEHVRKQLLDVGAHGRWAAAHRRVLPERNAGRGRVVLRHADPADRAAGPR